MQMNDSQRIAAPRQKVWEALNDPEVLKAAIPGCEELIKHSDTELEAKVKLKVGLVKATFGGKVTLNDLDPPNGYTIEGEGSGGVAVWPGLPAAVPRCALKRTVRMQRSFTMRLTPRSAGNWRSSVHG